MSETGMFGRRGTGRTTKMLDQVEAAALQGQHVMVVCGDAAQATILLAEMRRRLEGKTSGFVNFAVPEQISSGITFDSVDTEVKIIWDHAAAQRWYESEKKKIERGILRLLGQLDRLPSVAQDLYLNGGRL